MTRFLVYALTDPRSGAIRYIGKSTSELKRPRAHLRRCNDKGHRSNWIRQLLAAGLEYGITVLEQVASADLLDDAERKWIAFGRAQEWPLTNVLDGGDGAPHKQETKDKIRASLKGFKHSDATRAKMSAARKGKPPGTAGKPVTAETRARQSAAGRARPPRSPETRAKLSAAMRGKPNPTTAARNQTPEAKAQLATLHEMARGRPRPDLAARNASPEQREAVSRALKGRQFSDETLARMRAGQQRRWARDRGESSS